MLLRYLCAVLMPPVAVLLRAGMGRELVASIILTFGFPLLGLLIIVALHLSRYPYILYCIPFFLLGSPPTHHHHHTGHPMLIATPPLLL